MEILVDGNRSTSDSWLAAHRIPAQKLPALSVEEQKVAEKLSISAEDYQRSKYAAELTKRELEVRAFRVGQLIEEWLRTRGISTANVHSVWLKTFDGKFRVDVRVGDSVEFVFLNEDLINELLDSGSQVAQQSLDRLLAANFLSHETAKAS